MKKLHTILASSLLMMSLISGNAQVPNGGFENWVSDGTDNNPVDWETTNSDPFVCVTPYTPAYAGNYSMRVSAFDAGFMTVPGAASIEFPYTQRPSLVKACIKATVMPGDKVFLIVSLFQGDSIIAAPTNGTFVIDTTISEFTCLSFPITYLSNLTPDHANIMVLAGITTAQLGTEIIVDELSFDLSPVLDKPMLKANTSKANYPNPAGNFTYIPIDLLNESDVDVLLWNSNGNLVQSSPFHCLKEGKQELLVNTSQLTNGMYPYLVVGEDFTISGKIEICK